MLLSRPSLMTLHAAARDAADEDLHCVHVAEDGTCVASNGSMLMAVSPVDEKRVTFPDVENDEGDVPENGVSIPLGIVRDAVKNLPTDKTSSLQHAKVTRCDSREVELMTTDGARKRKVSGQPERRRFPRWKKLLGDAKNKASTTRICINRRDLIRLLDAMDKACPDKGNFNPAFIEIGGENDCIYIRGINNETRQVAVGMVKPLDAGGSWLPEGEWEKKTLRGDDANGAVVKRRKKRKA